VIFLHGWGGSISSFLFAAKRISRNYRVTLFDFAGFGETPEPSFAYSVSDYAADVLKLMDTLNIKSAVLVGHSFGGRVAMELAAKFPSKVDALVLVDSAGIKPKRKPKYYIKVFIHKLLKKLGLKGLRGSSDYSILTPVMKQSFIKVVNYDQSHLLPLIRQQTALFWGDGDKETPFYMAKKLKNGIRNSELFMLRGGHFAYAEDSARFIIVLLAFLDALKLSFLGDAVAKEDGEGKKCKGYGD
jgi:pimeloyl-ACP methyl ester carboxylesterase